MPPTQVYFYRDEDGTSPPLEWLGGLGRRDPRAAKACLAKLRLLRVYGHELRRPYSDLLRDGIYELRARVGRVNYRILYFFHGRNVAVVAYALTKEQEVPHEDIERAIERKRRYERAPEAHRETADF